jgi:hypothetical protein
MVGDQDLMRIECIHGYFKFFETKVGQMSTFMRLFEFELERSGDHFTFSDLVDAPDYSLKGGTFLGCPTTETFEGNPWEVMRENGIVYNFLTGTVVPIATILQSVKVQAAENFYVASGIILPGSVRDDGTRVTDYSAFFLNPQFKYSEVASG